MMVRSPIGYISMIVGGVHPIVPIMTRFYGGGWSEVRVERCGVRDVHHVGYDMMTVRVVHT